LIRKLKLFKDRVKRRRKKKEREERRERG